MTGAEPQAKVRKTAFATPLPNQTFGALVHVPIPAILADPGRYAAELLRAYEDHALLCWPGAGAADLTPDQEVELMKLLPWDDQAPAEKLYGPLGSEHDGTKERYSRWRIPARPEVLLQGEGQIKDHHGLNGFLSSGKPVREWHSDGLHELDTPPIATSMYSVEVPTKGGNTLFCDAREIFKALPADLQEMALRMRVRYNLKPKPMHPSGYRAKLPEDGGAAGSLGLLYDTESNRADAPRVPGETHPLVFACPLGRKALVVAPMWVDRLVEVKDGREIEWSPEETQRLLATFLRAGADSEYSHQWARGDFVVWDNRQLLHSASGLQSIEGLRLLHRVRLCGKERPTAPAH